MHSSKPAQYKLLIIDDEENMLHMLSALLSKEGYAISTANGAEEALDIINIDCFDFILCDIKMPGMTGFEFLKEISDLSIPSTIIMMSAYADVDIAIEAMKAGAYDFISKPFKKDEVLITLRKAAEREKLKKENRLLKDEIAKVNKKQTFNNLVYCSPEMKQCVDIARKVAEYTTPVLITGQSGTGKELLAQGIHHHSPRKDRHFFVINCGSIPSDLLESELFGFVKGAFTGADKNKKGIFEEADKSTLFLDEIGELPVPMQSKLLRVLQENEIRQIGSNFSKQINVKIIAATSRNLEEEVEKGNFREDLFYRLNVIRIQIPALIDRPNDVPLLTDYFLSKYKALTNKPELSIAPELLKCFLSYNWPGNVRELENIIHRGVVLADNMVNFDQMPYEWSNNDYENMSKDLFDGVDSLKVAKKIFEKHLIEKALLKTEGNKSNAAKLLELSYPALLSKISKYDCKF